MAEQWLAGGGAAAGRAMTPPALTAVRGAERLAAAADTRLAGVTLRRPCDAHGQQRRSWNDDDLDDDDAAPTSPSQSRLLHSGVFRI